MKAKVLRIKSLIQEKNKEKIKRYKDERDVKQLKELSSLREEMGEFGVLKVFNNITIQPEGRKPPVIGSEEVKISEDEISLLSKGPKFALTKKSSWLNMKRAYARKNMMTLTRKK